MRTEIIVPFGPVFPSPTALQDKGEAHALRIYLKLSTTRRNGRARMGCPSRSDDRHRGHCDIPRPGQMAGVVVR